MTAAQLFVLGRVAAAPGQSLSELAAQTLTDRTSVAAIVERLAERRLVKRQRSADDRRRVEIYPTPRGVTTLARAPHPPTMRVLEAMAKLSTRELRSLAAGLTQLANAMGLGSQPAGMLFDQPLNGARGRPGRATSGRPPRRVGPDDA